MKGYVAQRRGRFYAVIYEGRDPITGKEIRRWHPAGLQGTAAGRCATRSLTFGAYMTNQWLPAKKLHLATSTYRGYERNVTLHVLPALGRVALRRLSCQQIEALYDRLLNPVDGPGLHPKTVYEIHLVIRGALTDAARRGLVTRNVATVARAPKQRGIQRVEGQSWTDSELRQFLRTAAGHRYFPILWLAANTGMRRNELVGLKWTDIDFAKQRLALNRGLVAVGYEVHETRGKTKTARRNIALDTTTLTVLNGWRALQAAEFTAVGIDNADQWLFTNGDGTVVHPHSVHQTFNRIVNNAGVRRIRFHDLRHTHGSLLIQAGVPVKVVSELLGHANIAFSMQTYQHLLPGMQEDAAKTAERLAAPVPTGPTTPVERRGNRRRKTA